MGDKTLFPDYVFESSWEVCNKVGGIYAVLSTRARTLTERLGDNLMFIGPDCWKDKENPFFEQDDNLFASWRSEAKKEGLQVKVGRWKVPGHPVSILVDFQPYFARKNEIYAKLWEDYKVDSLHAYGDYDEASMFSYAAGLVVESLYKHVVKPGSRVIYHGNEWMTGLGVLYVNHYLPQIGTVFTTHATSIGRSIAGNDKPLYQYLDSYNGDQMAAELNMQSKHSIEKQTALNVDCFTTVSEITARECKELLDKPVDVVLPNGFEDDFVPVGAAFTRKRHAARKRLLDIARDLTGTLIPDDALIVSTSGRYEFRNKGIDVFIESMSRLRSREGFERDVVAFIEVPGWVAGPREDLKARLASGATYDTPLDNPVITHNLHNEGEDRILGQMKWLGLNNQAADRVKVIFIPSYLIGNDGIVNLTYYDVVLGNDLAIYPSYYEPWGYTPLEAIAFKVPTITTNLAGFGMWAAGELNNKTSLEKGVKVVERTDYNYNNVVDEIVDAVLAYSQLDKKHADVARRNASKLSKKALWNEFIKYYYEAYDVALRKTEARSKELEVK